MARDIRDARELLELVSQRLDEPGWRERRSLLLAGIEEARTIIMAETEMVRQPFALIPLHRDVLRPRPVHVEELG